VGVQIKSGAYVPPGTTTAGTTITIVETGPSAGPSGTTTTTCQTQGSTIVPNSTASFCTVGEGPFPESYVVAPGDTATVTQTTVNANLVQDTTPRVVQPCVLQPIEGFVTCPPDVIGTDVVFTDPGLPPRANPDSATTMANHPIDVDVLANDQTGGAPATIDSVVQPAHGSVVIVPSSTAALAAAPAATGPTLRYTPDPGYVGADAFSYTMSTPNGSDSAKVDLTVTAPPPTASNDHAATTSGDPVTIRVLANDDANGGGTLSLASFTRPAHGTVTRDGNALVYTPAATFAGTDTFTYTGSTPFGTATATVTVTVTAPPSSVQPTSTSTSTTATASTGADVEQGVELGTVLLLLGGASTALGRRRASGRHAG